MKYTLVIPAAGQGKRMGAGKNKLLLPVRSVPLIIHTLRAFEQDAQCEKIVLVINPEEKALFARLLQEYRVQKPVLFAAGGAERQDSVYQGVLMAESAEYILVHDGARPFVTQQVIDEVLHMAIECGAATCAVPVKDTVKRVQDGMAVETIDRSSLWSVQTPQGFRAGILLAAHEAAKQAAFLGTDDASLVERMGERVAVTLGSYYNIKVTTPDDLIVAESFLNNA
ncbi:2-C-methyl-D-erythritol 4-phosphate cytidylyltransferase [Ectobacillus ponti]|uniref:2-C-methyl-D-erythritol 4-phosphate cytidylyltransferase n=1 Tax=Ectobacillus ponti TaxID=2961894 RepID=A0AA41X950_9BACI|nr:2-C-methyl-D-erythritol 4-phosphate cytidylyltransferase [Ectobacillus ponti]MCP8971087.1 2-C-methyl-D-erythritol 4-phosphate cytidylyltransferase [Ectobacillus ponti]